MSKLTNPFLGARPYGPANDRMFFGRDRATAALVERIDLQRLTILCSPSGLGKTSLLRASVMPWLEKDGLSPIYLKPDPPSLGAKGSESQAAASLLYGRLPDSLLQALLPSAELEVEVLRDVCALAPAALTLGDAPKWFDSLASVNPLRGRILEPTTGSLEIMPALSKYLRGSMVLPALIKQATLIGAETLAQLLQPSIRLTQLLESFPAAELAARIAVVRSRLQVTSDAAQLTNTADEALQLRTFLDGLCGTSDDEGLLARADGGANLCARVVLILDQFEQIFTMSSAHLARRALKLLADLVNQRIPLNIVLSIRKEWYADLTHHLAQHLKHAGRLAAETFYLEPMNREEATEVMHQAPMSVGARALSTEQQDSIWEFLQRDGTIDPVIISIACHEHFASGATESTVINDQGLGSLFDAYLDRALQPFSDKRDRNEALDLLGEVVGSALTREFATQDRLIHAPLASTTVRRRILKGLQDAYLVKGEDFGKARSKVYDIMHERLLGPIRVMLAKHPDIAAFRLAAQRLKQPGSAEQGIGWQSCLVLLRAARHVRWDALSAGVVLMSLLTMESRGKRGFPDDSATLSRRWLHNRVAMLARACSQTADRDKWTTDARTELNWWMTHREILDQAAAAPDRERDLFALKSLIQGPAGSMREELQALLRRVVEE